MFIEDGTFARNTARHGFFKKNAGIDDIAGIFSIEPEQLLLLDQVHGDTCLTVTEPWDTNHKPQADAMATDVPGLALAIVTADCAPVLFYGETNAGKPVIGAAHAGWQGALKGILESTIENMAMLGAVKEMIYTAIGPCIGPESYEISDDFKQDFLTHDQKNESFFSPGDREGHAMFDLPGYVTARLKSTGVEHVYAQNIDTCSSKNDFFSYRRAACYGEVENGRQISAIMIGTGT